MLPRDWRLTTRGTTRLKEDRDPVLVTMKGISPGAVSRASTWSMPARSFDPRFQRSWGNFRGRRLPSRSNSLGPSLLVYRVTHQRCRRALFELRHPDAVIEEVRRFTFYDPGSPDFERRRQRFRTVMGRSRFVRVRVKGARLRSGLRGARPRACAGDHLGWLGCSGRARLGELQHSLAREGSRRARGDAGRP